MRYRALLAAIDDYGSARNNLPSCLNDLGYVQELLVGTLKAPESRIRKLVNAQVTTQAVREGLEWLTHDPADDERLLFFFSGHGYQVARGAGKVDEALVLAGSEFFFDDKLVECSKAAKPGTLTVLLDCCFGGGNDKVFAPTGNFGAFITAKRWSPPDDFLEKNLQLAGADAVEVSSYRPFGSRRITSKGSPSLVLSASGMTPWPTAIDEAGQPLINGVLLAACLEDETASASTVQTQGLSAFTYALKRVVEQQGVDVTLQQARDGTDSILKRMGFRQTSTLKIGTGPIDRDSRFLSLERKPGAASWLIDRRIGMTDTKFLEDMVPVLVERVVRELTKKGYTPNSNGSDKFFPGFAEIVVPALVGRVVDELTKKGYKPAVTTPSAPDKSLVSDIVREIMREATRKDFTPPDAGVEKFGLRDVAEIVIRELTKQGYVANGDGSEKFIPGVEILGPLVVREVVRHFAR